MASIRVVGLGPAGLGLVTLATWERLASNQAVKRARTSRHPALDEAAERGVVLASYDDFYERADSFEDLYQMIAADLIRLAHEQGDVLYVVPGSPVVAERTVELLLAQHAVPVIIEPAVSVIDVACGALGRDPMSAQVRIVDALAGVEPFRGPGPLLVLQTYAPEILASVADRLPPDAPVTVLHHLGLDDQVITTVPARELRNFAADHLTSIWIEGLRTAGEAMDDLVDFMRRLRAECPWDQEQTHASLTRHLLEESYEALDALEALVASDEAGEENNDVVAHVEEELGDLLFQIVFHAELGDEEGRFNFATIADAVRDKLTYRHPHVFGDTVVTDADDVASRWEVLKKKEKGRSSVTDGIAWQLPALTLYTKLLRKADAVGVALTTGDQAREQLRAALEELSFRETPETDAISESVVADAWGDVLVSLAQAARWAGVDLEAVLRSKALRLRDEIRTIEAKSPGN